MRRHILIYSINYFPELTNGGKYSGELANWLARYGYEVRVVTAYPYYPQWKVGEGYSSRWFRREVVQNVRVLRCPLWVPQHPDGLKRILHLASFALFSFPALLFQIFSRPHVVFVIAPALFCAPAGWFLARLTGALAWLHIQDFEVDAAFELGILSGHRQRTWVCRLERILLRCFDCVSTISESMQQRLREKGVDADKIYLFPNWVDVGQISPLSGASAYRSTLGIAADTCVAFYSGNMGKKQGLEILAEVASRLRDRSDIIFIFCGDGAGRDELVQACMGLPNVCFLDLQPAERLNELLNLADIHLLPQRADAVDLVMPSKLTGMLASGRPVVATVHADTEVARILGEAGGYCTPPGDAGEFARAILSLVDQPLERKQLGQQARAYAERTLSHDSVLQRFVERLNFLSATPIHCRRGEGAKCR